MTNKFWNSFAKHYDSFMKKDQKPYDIICKLIKEKLTKDMNVLEIATGTGYIADNICSSVNLVEATDYSPKMISEAKKKHKRYNLHFSMQNAYALPYADKSFDAVIIANALHIMDNPRVALCEIKRILKGGGLLFAPTFGHNKNVKSFILKIFGGLIGFKIYSSWSFDEYMNFIEGDGFEITDFKTIKASMPIMYVEAKNK